MAEEDLHLRPTTSDKGSELVEPAETRRGVPFIRTLSWTKGLFVLLRSRTEKHQVYVVLCAQYLHYSKKNPRPPCGPLLPNAHLTCRITWPPYSNGKSASNWHAGQTDTISPDLGIPWPVILGAGVKISRTWKLMVEP